MVGVHGLGRRAAVATLIAASVAGAIGATVAPARAATPNRAAVVVEVNGVVHTAKITFAADSISGLDALRNAGFAPAVRVFGGNGGAVCALDVGTVTIGCPADGTCLNCAAPDYWAYFRAVAGATRYTYSATGAGNTQVHDGDVEAWAWGTGSAPPTFVSFSDVWGPDPPPTTVRPPTTPPPTRPPSTPPTTVHALESPTTSPATIVPTSAAGAGSTTTAKPARATASRAGSTTTGAGPTSNADSATTGAVRKVATAPIVQRGGGGSPYGLVGFAVILAGLVAAIAVARRRKRVADGR